MNRERRRDLFEAVGLLVVVASLLILILEIRQNTNALYAQSRHAIMEASQLELILQFDNPDIALSIIKEDSLTQEEQIRLDAFLTSTLRAREFAWLQYRDGVIDDDQFATELAVITTIFDASRNRRWWNVLGREYVSGEFGTFIDDVLESRAATDTVWQSVPVWERE
jgi:hypothetical protein